MLTGLRLTLESVATKQTSGVPDGVQPYVLPAGERPRPRNGCLPPGGAVPSRVAALWYHDAGLRVKPDLGLKARSRCARWVLLPTLKRWVSAPEGTPL
jgi:hypothetical protein